MRSPRTLFVLLILLAIAAGATAATEEALTPPRENPVPCCQAVGDYDQDGVQDRLDKCNNTPQGCVVDIYGCYLDEDGDKVCDGLDQCPGTPKGEKVNKVGCSASQLEAAKVQPVPPPPPPAQEIERPATPPPPTPPQQTEAEKQLVETGSIVLRDVYFETEKATILPESEAKLNEAGAALEKFSDLKVEIQGHTDSRGTKSYNQRLSQQRAESVRQYLLSHFHLNPDNYTAKGYGETQLLVSPEKSADDYAQNRRVVLNVTNPDALPTGVTIEEQK